MPLELLPTVAERNALVADLATLIARAGFEHVVAAHVVEPSDRYFPDEWQPDHDGVTRLARRIFDYAGLGDIAIEVELAPADRAIAGGIWAVELGANLAKLGADRERLTDPLATIATLARFAAIVFRARHEISGETAEVESRAIDATTVYLGFGIVTTNAAYRYRASGELRGNTAVTRWSHTELGALSPQALAYLLAVQLVARGVASDQRRVARALETNQASYFEAAVRALDGDELLVRLGLPARSTWPARQPPPPETAGTAKKLLMALTAAPGPSIPAAIAKSAAVGGRNTGRAVFRMTRTRTGMFAFVGIFVAMVPTIALAVHGYGVLAMVALFGTPLVCAPIGSRARRDECADSRCSRILPPGLERCPGCGGTIAGTLLKGENRLEAEERLGVNQDDDDYENPSSLPP